MIPFSTIWIEQEQEPFKKEICTAKNEIFASCTNIFKSAL